MHNLDLILTLTGGLAAALVLGYITQRLGLSPIVGYLLAGIARRAAHARVRRQREHRRAARRGRRHPADVRRRPAVPRRGTAGGAARRRPGRGRRRASSRPRSARWSRTAFGWGWSAGIVFGMALSVASTVVLIRVLADNRDLHTPTGHIAVGWLVVEDLFTVLVLVLLPALFGAASGASAAWRRARCSTAAQGRRRSSPSPSLVGARRHPVAARSRRRDAVARAVHADRAGARARHRRRLGARSSACRWRSARSSPAWSSAGPTSACARRPTRCRCATRSPCCSSSRSACCSTRATLLEAPGLIAGDAGDRPDRQAAGRARDRAGCCGYPLADRRSPSAVALAQIGEFSFILADARPRARHAAARGHATRSSRSSIVSIVAQPAALPRDRADRAVGAAPAAAVAAAESDRGRASRRRPASGRARSTRATGRSWSATARPGGR